MLASRDIYISTCNRLGVGHQLTDEELKVLQSHLFKMYRDLEAVCKRHNLKIMLAYGNVLGVLRHGGWIPWDDDLDVFMPRQDYDKLLNDYIDELPEHYRVYAPHTKWGPSYRFAKVVDTNTVFSQLDGNPDNRYYQGVFIDIFPIENISLNKFANKLRKFWSFFLSYTATSVEHSQNKSEVYRILMCSSQAGKINYYLRKLWGKVFSFVPPSQWYRWIDKFNQYDKVTGYVHIPTDTTPAYAWVPLPDSMFFPMRECKFNNEGKVLIPAKSEKFLKIIYGNWEQIPPADRIWHHYVTQFNIDKE